MMCIRLFLSSLLFVAILLVANTATSAHGGDHSSPSTSSTPCPSKLGFSSNLIPFDTSSLYCNSVWSAQDFILMYQKSGGSMWNFVLSAPNKKSYIGIGFSDNGKMVGSRAVVGWMPEAGNGSAKQYFLGGYSPPECPPDKGALKLGRTLIFEQSSRLYLAFELNVSDSQHPKNKLIYAIGPSGRFPGANGLLAEHTDMFSNAIDYAIGSEGEAPSPSARPMSPAKDNGSARRLTLTYISAISIPLAILVL